MHRPLKPVPVGLRLSSTGEPLWRIQSGSSTGTVGLALSPRFAGCTAHPTGAWVVQQARHLAWKIQDGELQPRFLLRDGDTKFTAAFDNAFQSGAWTFPSGSLGPTRVLRDEWALHAEKPSTTCWSLASVTSRMWRASSFSMTTKGGPIRASTNGRPASLESGPVLRKVGLSVTTQSPQFRYAEAATAR